MKREAGAGGAGSLALCQEREGPCVPQWRSYHTRTFARRMWRCIYSANYATRARPKLLRHTHHVESRDANVHASPPLARELVRSHHGDLPVRGTLFICVYLQPEAGGYSRRANLASQAAGRHTHPGCAVDLKESGAPSQHLPLSLSQYQDTGPAIIQTHPHRTAPQV